MSIPSGPFGLPSQQSIVPAFLRLPKSGQRCPYSGLTRSAMDALVRPCQSNGFRPPVSSKKLRTRGAATRRGAVLVDTASLLAYLHSMERESAPAQVGIAG